MNLFLFAVTAALTLQPESSLRIVNPHPTPAVATICGKTLQLAPNDVVDLAKSELCETPTLDASASLLSFELRDDTQRLLGDADTCPAPAMTLPSFACPLGTTTATVPAIDGATYTWTVEGASILDGAGTNRVQLVLGEAPTATINVAIQSALCQANASGVIAVRAPLTIRDLKASDEPQADKPVVLTWSFGPGAEPKSQLLVGDLFAEPVVLPAEARSYTFTPDSGGTKNIELRASYAVTLAPPAPKKRRRAAGATLEPIVVCPAASAKIQLDVRGCAATRPRIVVPEDVEANAPFSATINVAEGEKVQWSVENGVITSTSSDGSRANLRAGATGEVVLTARKEGAELCIVTGTARVPIYAAAAQCPIAPPTAVVSLASFDCEGATVKATFTGKPPFSGTWSDGTEFRVSLNSVTRRIAKAGTYGLASFHDASCGGVISGSAKVEAYRPTVKLTAAQSSCGGAKLTATFTGTPPFSATWGDGVAFTTPTNTATRDVPAGRWYVTYVKDAVCHANTYGYGSSEMFDVKGAPKAYVSAYKSCLTSIGETATLFASFTEPAQPPFRIEWADGAVSESTRPREYPIGRSVPAPAQFEKTYTATRAVANGCEIELMLPSDTIFYRPIPQIEFPDQNPCIGEVVSARVSNTMPPNAKFSWSVPGATVVEGRLSPKLTFTSDKYLYSKPEVEASYPDGLCASTNFTYVRFSETLPAIDLHANATTIEPGGNVAIDWKDVTGGNYGFEAAPARTKDLVIDGCRAGVCHAKFYDTVGSGTVTLSINWADCVGSHSEKVTVTITP